MKKTTDAVSVHSSGFKVICFMKNKVLLVFWSEIVNENRNFVKVVKRHADKVLLDCFDIKTSSMCTEKS